MEEYKKGMSRGTGFGVRDEYRIGGQALEPFLNSALEKVLLKNPSRQKSLADWANIWLNVADEGLFVSGRSNPLDPNPLNMPISVLEDWSMPAVFVTTFQVRVIC